MKVQTVVARNLRRLRVAKGVAQEALAVDAAIDRTYVSRLERGKENPTVAILERLAKALDAHIADFFDTSSVRAAIKPLPSGRRKKE